MRSLVKCSAVGRGWRCCGAGAGAGAAGGIQRAGKGSNPRCVRQAAMRARSAWFGTSSRDTIGSRVCGDVLCVASQCAMAALSYEWPSLATTGSAIMLSVMGHMYSDGASSCDGASPELWDVTLRPGDRCAARSTAWRMAAEGGGGASSWARTRRSYWALPSRAARLSSLSAAFDTSSS